MKDLLFSSISSQDEPPTVSTASTKVILVRHARTTYNEQGRYQGSSDESALTKKGHQAAYSTGLALRQFTFEAIYTSPLTRVRQTTEAIVAALGQITNNLPPVLTNHNLTEIQMSNWQGLFYREVKKKFPQAYRCWQETPHLFSFDDNLFPVLELYQQGRDFWQEILTKHRGQTILIVAHSGTNRALIGTAIGLKPENYHCLQQSNCGISYLEFPSLDHYRGYLKYLNVTTHLGENLPKLKAGKTGWRWLLMSNKATRDLLNSSYAASFIRQNLIDLILTDDSLKSKHLTCNLLKNNNRIIHLSIARNRFLENWQQTIFNRQKLNSGAMDTGLITGLVIVPENLLSQILAKTLCVTAPSVSSHCLSVIHYPKGGWQFILQGLLPLTRQAIATDDINSNITSR